jgi:hypothetical protein
MRIQIKRSPNNTNADTNTEFGELSFAGKNSVLYINNSSTSIPIAANRNPGLLTANQELVTNSSSFVDRVLSENIVINKIYANNTYGEHGQVLMSGGSGRMYWGNLEINYDTLYRHINVFVPYDTAQNEYILNYKVERDLILLENFSNSIAYTENLPSINQTLSIYKNNTEIGTVSFYSNSNYGIFSNCTQTTFNSEFDVFSIKQTTVNDPFFKNYSVNIKFIKRVGYTYIPTFPDEFNELTFETNELNLESNKIGFPG